MWQEAVGTACGTVCAWSILQEVNSSGRQYARTPILLVHFACSLFRNCQVRCRLHFSVPSSARPPPAYDRTVEVWHYQKQSVGVSCFTVHLAATHSRPSTGRISWTTPYA